MSKIDEVMKAWQEDRKEVSWSDLQAIKEENDALRAQIGKGVPVAWYDEDMDSAYTAGELDGWKVHGLTPLYTHPAPQQKPLTDEQIEAIFAAIPVDKYDGVLSVARAIKAAHNIGEKK